MSWFIVAVNSEQSLVTRSRALHVSVLGLCNNTRISTMSPEVH